MTAILIATAAEIAKLTEIAAQLGPWSLPLIEAAKSGTIDLMIVRRTQPAPLQQMHTARRPVVLWIGDDDGGATGPDGWRCAKVATAWARSAVVHAAGGEAAHYREVVHGALVTIRTLLIETSSAHAKAWTALLVGKPVLVIIPPEGRPHPVYDRERRH